MSRESLKRSILHRWTMLPQEEMGYKIKFLVQARVPPYELFVKKILETPKIAHAISVDLG